MRRRDLLTGAIGLCLGMPSAAGAAFPAGLGTVDGTVVWVDFWASWCAPCRRSFPWLNRMHRKYAAQGLEVIGVNVDKDRKLAEAFLDETPAQFTLRFDPAGKLAEQFGVQAMPSSFLLDATGKTLAAHFGFKLADADAYERDIRRALEAAQAQPASTVPQ